MVCTACEHDNQPNAKFCSDCGAPLARACPSCGRRQPPTAKFCDECGTSLTEPPIASAMVFTIPRIHRVSDAGSLFERIERAVGEIGDTHVVFVNQFVGERIQRIEAFDITQLDQALARYDELIEGHLT
jgi:hypothetical protein